MNQKFAGAVVTRAQVRRNQELLSSRLKEEGEITKEFESSCGSDKASEEGESSCGSDRASEEGEELKSLSTEVEEENQSTEESEMEMGNPKEGGRRTDESKIDGNCD